MEDNSSSTLVSPPAWTSARDQNRLNNKTSKEGNATGKGTQEAKKQAKPNEAQTKIYLQQRKRNKQEGNKTG
jgi:hypothetical protein